MTLLQNALPACGQPPLRLTARVDTTNKDVKSVFQLVGRYLNNHPDSLFANPDWQPAEVQRQVVGHQERVDLAAPFLFADLPARRMLALYQPTVLSIEPVGSKYLVRVLFYAENPPKWITDSRWNPPHILRYYAARDAGGAWKLENSWGNELARWRTYQTRWISFHYPPTLAFSEAKARQASRFCDSLATTLKLPDAKPFDYYLMSSEEELGRLFNFDYWLAYNTGFTQKAHNRIFSARGRESHLHEFVHIMYHPVPNYFLAEGIATYLGGVDGYTPYQQTLRDVARDLLNKPTVSFADIYNNKYRNQTNNNPRYAAGALVYALVRAKVGIAGFAKLEESANTYESLLGQVGQLLHLKPTQVEAYLLRELKSYATYN
ncbi:hypothetical protein EJV47_22840 [Hymenobacter gummosus]|uniref:Peptidase MA-like domain-containing protein n=1 Tax=Hymenobacter gummosus TaxID=1776032 RepID=A0A431TWI8_9BACT|nr:hypothetical protein [Hymenobacter gummosus]RTQ45999.1 hypothetical protein EJV47_22840 [Hymenobacter gummosus]